MKPVLQVRDLRKSFASELVLEKISFQVPEHSATVFIGASGSGKSTLIKLLTGLYKPVAGEIVIDGETEITEENLQEYRELLP